MQLSVACEGCYASSCCCAAHQLRLRAARDSCHGHGLHLAGCQHLQQQSPLLPLSVKAGCRGPLTARCSKQRALHSCHSRILSCRMLAVLGLCWPQLTPVDQRARQYWAGCCGCGCTCAHLPKQQRLLL